MSSNDETPATRLNRVRDDAPTHPDLPGLNRPAGLGKMAMLHRPVVLYDPHSNRFEVIACNDVGAIVTGPAPPNPSDVHLSIMQLRLGRRDEHQDHFFLVDVLDSEEVRGGGSEPLTRFTVRWNGFAGSAAGATSDFAAKHLRINLDARRVHVTQPKVTPSSPQQAMQRSARCRTPIPGRDAAVTATRQLSQDSVSQLTAAPSSAPLVTPQPKRPHRHKRAKTPVSMRRPRTPLSISRSALPAGALAGATETPEPPRRSKPVTKPAPAPGMGPSTEDRLLKGRRPIPLGSGE